MFLFYKLHTLNFQKTKGFLKKFFGFFCAHFLAFRDILFLNLIAAVLRIFKQEILRLYYTLNDLFLVFIYRKKRGKYVIILQEYGRRCRKLHMTAEGGCFKLEANRILVVEDDKDIREGIEIYLRNQGYVVFQAGDGVEGLQVIMQEEIHLAIVDIMMPRMDGITMMMKVRDKGYDFPVIMLSAKSEEVDKIMGLNMGADDYVTKPFTTMELLARVNSHLRRYRRYLDAVTKAAEPENDTYHCLGGIEVNEETVEVFVDGNPVKLTPIEFKILLLLIKNPGRVFSADEIYERIWNEKAINTDTIMVHIRKIREKIEIDPKNPKYLKVVWGVGYKMEKQ